MFHTKYSTQKELDMAHNSVLVGCDVLSHWVNDSWHLKTR